MKTDTTIYGIALLLALTVAAPIQAGQDHPEQQDEKAKQEKPAPPPQRQASPQKDQKDQKDRADSPQRQPASAAPKRQSDSARQQREQANAQQEQQKQQRQQDSSRKHEQQIAEGQQNQQRQQQQQSQDISKNRQPPAETQRLSQRNQNSRPESNPAQSRQRQIAFQETRARSWQSEHHSWQQRGGYSGYRVPDDRFQQYYGSNHYFRIESLPIIYVGGRQRFQYGGYWFGLIDPWPEYWSDNWYDQDDVYVGYENDGYYLHNRRYPGDLIAIAFYVN